MDIYNSHTHTSASPDCTAPIRDMCRAAYQAGFMGLTITDHCCGSVPTRDESFDVVDKSFADSLGMQKEYEGKMEILRGVELDEMFWHPEFTQSIIDAYPFDVVLASVHKVSGADDQGYFSAIDFSTYTKEKVFKYAKLYFDDVLKTAESADFDILSHLTVLFRYITGKYKIEFDLSVFYPIIDEILKVIINRDKALEVNSSSCDALGLMPDEDILKRYLSLGGTRVTLGTDAHTPGSISAGLDTAVSTLKKLGFDSYYYYKNRKPLRVKLEE